jgi:hypothetical protein
MNWRGKPLVAHEVIVSLIAATTTRSGLTVQAALDILTDIDPASSAVLHTIATQRSTDAETPDLSGVLTYRGARI